MAEPRICVIGNSHAAAWRAGLNAGFAPERELRWDFFVAQGDLMRNTELRDTVIIPTAEETRRRVAAIVGPQTEIETRDYHCFVLVGLGISLVDAVEALRGFQLLGVETPAEDLRWLSRPCYMHLIKSLLRASTALHIAKLLRRVTDKPIFLVPQPYPSEAILRMGWWSRVAASGALGLAMACYRQAVEAIARELDCELLLQPESTLGRHSLTLESYAVDSVRLSADLAMKHPAEEPFHMNAAFGTVMLEAFAHPSHEHWSARA